MTRWRIVLAFTALSFGSAAAAEVAGQGPVAVFERAYSTSLYVFDGCGDGVAGDEFRKALAEKFASCAFGPQATLAYQHRTALAKHKAHETMNRLIAERGGVPMRLEGMSTTCHSHREEAAYQEMLAKLDAFAQGKIGAEAIIPAKCDAAEIAP